MTRSMNPPDSFDSPVSNIILNANIPAQLHLVIFTEHIKLSRHLCFPGITNYKSINQDLIFLPFLVFFKMPELKKDHLKKAWISLAISLIQTIQATDVSSHLSALYVTISPVNSLPFSTSSIINTIFGHKKNNHTLEILISSFLPLKK